MKKAKKFDPKAKKFDFTALKKKEQVIPPTIWDGWGDTGTFIPAPFPNDSVMPQFGTLD